LFLKLSRSDFPKNRAQFFQDIFAGVTVALVAIPLAIGFGVTSGMSASTGIATAIIAGFIAALFGGSRFQISGPTGAMTVVLIPVIHKFGVGAIPTLGVMAGMLLILMSILQLGNWIKRVPHFVIEGFTFGIAIVIALQQLPLVLNVSRVSGDRTLQVALGTVKKYIENGIELWPIAIAVLTLIVKFNTVRILQFLKIKFYIPASFVALLVSTTFVKVFKIDIPDIAEIPRNVFVWSPPNFSQVLQLLWPALMIALLAAIESLLSARIAEKLATHTEPGKMDANRELLGQGLATAFASILGGQPATGAIARTAVNVRSKAHTRLASMMHSLTILIIIVAVAPLFSQIPAAALGGVLIGASIRILNPANLKETLRTTPRELIVFFATALVTISVDLIWGVGVGLAVYLFGKRFK
jgi:SulP family sulfate permease